MQHVEAISLIGKAIQTTHAERWADLGCGSGTFTKALAALLPAGSHIIAIDQQKQSFNIPGVEFYRADLVQDPLPLQLLDGILMANAFHYVRDKAALITKLESYFFKEPRFVFVEYDTTRSNPWVPYPISFAALQSFFAQTGYQSIKVSERRSSFGGLMYTALVTR
jgi:ubiquinone/menaquinone biosynthesis C-methylase UbiE